MNVRLDVLSSAFTERGKIKGALALTLALSLTACAQTQSAPAASAPVWQNANDCAPDAPVPHFDAQGAAAGYTCIRNQPGYPIAANTPAGNL